MKHPGICNEPRVWLRNRFLPFLVFVYSLMYLCLDVDPKWSADFVRVWDSTWKQSCRFREICSSLLQAIKLKSTSASLKTRSHLNKKGSGEKKKSISRGCVTPLQCVPPSVPKAVCIRIFFFINLLCVRCCIGFAQSARINVSDTTEEWSGGELWIHAAVGFEPRCNISRCIGTRSCISVLCTVTLKTVYFLEVELATQLLHLQKVSIIKSTAEHLLSSWVSALCFSQWGVSSALKRQFNM